MRNKKTYSKPILENEDFIPQEYIAACWLIECDVKTGSGYWETNGEAGCQPHGYLKKLDHFPWGKWVKGDKAILEDARGCGITHKGVQLPTAPSPNCYWVTDEDNPPKEFNAFYWYQKVEGGDGHLPQHFSTLRNFETNPNAS